MKDKKINKIIVDALVGSEAGDLLFKKNLLDYADTLTNLIRGMYEQYGTAITYVQLADIQDNMDALHAVELLYNNFSVPSEQIELIADLGVPYSYDVESQVGFIEDHDDD